MYKERGLIPKTCEECNKTFMGRKRRRFCDKSCAISSNNKLRDRKLENNANWKGGDAKKKYKLAYPNRLKANSKLAHLIAIGEIKRGIECEVCHTSNRSIVGHHEDYSKPLVVIWLCQSCHMKHHFRCTG